MEVAINLDHASKGHFTYLIPHHHLQLLLVSFGSVSEVILQAVYILRQEYGANGCNQVLLTNAHPHSNVASYMQEAAAFVYHLLCTSMQPV